MVMITGGFFKQTVLHSYTGKPVVNLEFACLQVPDIMSLQSPQDLKLEEGIAAVVEFGLGNLFSFAAKV